jgi:hypothetical protein
MTQWTPELEGLIRKVGEAMDKQMKDLVNPEKSVLGSGLRAAFRGRGGIHPLLKQVCNEAGVDFNPDSTMRALIKLCEENNSDAASNLKKWVGPYEEIARQSTSLRGISRSIKYAKKKYGDLAK